MLTEEKIQEIAEREAHNVADGGSPGAMTHNAKTIACAIREALRLNDEQKPVPQDPTKE